MALRQRNIESPPFKGLRLDWPVDGGFTRAVNAEFDGRGFRQRNPRDGVDAGIPTGGERFRNMFYLEKEAQDILLVDAVDPVTGQMKVMGAYNSPDGTGTNFGTYYDTRTGLPVTAPCYATGDIGAYRCDGNENLIIQDVTTVHGNGVTPPDTAPTQGAGSATFIAPPLPPGDFQAEGVQAPGEGGFLAGGQYQVFLTYVKSVGGEFFESGNSVVKTVTVPDGSQGMIKVTFPPSPDPDVSVVWLYRSKRIGTEETGEDEFTLEPAAPTFYREGETGDDAGEFNITYIDDALDSAFSQYTGMIDGDPAASFSQYYIYSVFVKKYADGRVTLSNPSPVLEVTGGLDTVFSIGYQVSTEPGVTHIRFYRSLFQNADFHFRVTEIANTGTMVTLDLTDDEIISFGDVLAFDNGKVPAAKYVLQHEGCMVYLNFPGETGGGCVFRWSKTNFYEHVPADYAEKFDPEDGNPITGAFVLYGNFYVAKRNKIKRYTRSSVGGRLVYGGRVVSNTIGVLEQRTVQAVGAREVVFLSLEGVMLFNGQDFANLSRGKVQDTVIKEFISKGGEFYAAFYPGKRQYHFLMYLLDEAGLIDRTRVRYLVCDLEVQEWTEMVFTKPDGTPVFDMCLGTASDANNSQIVISASFVGTGNVALLQQYDCAPAAGSETGEDIREISLQSAWSCTIDSTNNVFFLAKDAADDREKVFKIEYNGTIYGTAAAIGTPYNSGDDGKLLELKECEGRLFVLCKDTPLDGEETLRIAVYDAGFSFLELDLENNYIYVSYNKLSWIPLPSGKVFFSWLSPDPAYGVFSKTTEASLGYSEDDIVFEKYYRHIKRYLGRTQHTLPQSPTNGNYFHWAFLKSEVAAGTADHSIYLYDQTGTLNENDVIHFAGIHLGFGTNLQEGVEYEIHEIEDRIFTVHAVGGGPAISIGPPYYSHDGEYLDYYFKHFEVPPIIRWLPAIEDFAYESNLVYYQHYWQYLTIEDYRKPLFGLAWSSTSFYYNEFQFGDAFFGKSVTYLEDESGNQWVYFSWVRETDQKILVSRIRADAGEFDPREIEDTSINVPDPDSWGNVFLYVTPDLKTIHVYNGYNWKKYSEDAGWSMAGMSDSISLRWTGYSPSLQAFWGYNGENFTLTDMSYQTSIIPGTVGGIIDFAPSATKDMLVCCHATEVSYFFPSWIWYPSDKQYFESWGVTSSTVYLVEVGWKDTTIAAIIEDLETSDTSSAELEIFGVKVELISCYSGRFTDHFRKRIRNGYFEINSAEPSVGQVSIRPGRNTRDKEDVPSWDFIYCEGTPGYAGEDRNDLGRLHEVEVYQAADTTTFRWELTAGDMLADSHSGLLILPPGFCLQVEGEHEDE